jgi:hypothetical protein
MVLYSSARGNERSDDSGLARLRKDRPGGLSHIYFLVGCGNPGSFNFKSQPQSSPAFLAVF